jgi:hypothetical protein
LSADTRFASRIFRSAAIYGVIVVFPLYMLAVPDPWHLTHLGFVGVVLVFQGVFWVIADDPLRYHRLILLGVFEKICFGVPAISFALRGQVNKVSGMFGMIDLLLGALFLLAWVRLRKPT